MLFADAGGSATCQFDYEIAGRQMGAVDARQQVRKCLYEAVYICLPPNAVFKIGPSNASGSLTVIHQLQWQPDALGRLEQPRLQRAGAQGLLGLAP